MIAPARPTDVVLRVERNHHYKTISTLAVEDDRLSWKAKGLHTYLTTRPDSWSFNCADLVNRSSDGKDAVKTGLKELKEFGYLIITPRQGDGGRMIGWTWTIFESAPESDIESPGPSDTTESRKTENPSDGKPGYIAVNRITNNTQVRTTKAQRVYPEAFEEAWKATPYRVGNNPKIAAFKAWSARIKEGESPQALIDAAHRYADFCDANNLTESPMVMMGSTFFGPNRPYEQDWDIPAPSARRWH